MLQVARPCLRRVATLLRACALGLSLALTFSSAHADGPVISEPLKKMLGGLPIKQSKGELQALMAALKKTPCGNGLTGCYATQSGKMQLYLFSSQQAQQTMLLVINDKVAMPSLLKANVQHLFGGSALGTPILSLSTTDYTLELAKMPPALQDVVKKSYFGVGSLQFASGVQIAARADIAGVLKMTFQSLGVDTRQMTLRAAVVMPIPADLVGGAGTAAGAGDSVAHGDSLKKAGAEALKPEAFIEFQFGPKATIKLPMPKATLTDATFFINNELVFGYKGNAVFDGTDKKTILQFQTPLTPEGAMDLLDFSFRMATPPSYTLQDNTKMLMAMASPDPRLAKYGGGFIRNIDVLKKPLDVASRPLAAFQVRNPVPHNEYKFGDPAQPFPQDKNFNVIIAGPLADGGPLMVFKADAYFLGQKMGGIDVVADIKGFNGEVTQDLSLKLGPLGKVTLQKMLAQAQVNKSTQLIRLKGNYYGQVVETILDGDQLTLNVPANCVNPFEIKARLTFTPTTNLADVFDAQGGANVDPRKIAGCVGKELEAALRKISTEYKNMGGYTAQEANEALKQISGTAEYVAEQTRKQAEYAAEQARQAAAEEAARQAEIAKQNYERTKNAARDVANKSTSATTKAFADAGNAFKKLGKKKKPRQGPDPRLAASVFDWDYYYDIRPDVVAAGADLTTHWKDSGFFEGRRASPEFDTHYYRNRYPDVQAACAQGDYTCVVKHWVETGIEDGRQGSADFSIHSLMSRYADLPNAYPNENYGDLMEWWFNIDNPNPTGPGGRDGRPDSAYAGQVSGPRRVGGNGGGAWSDMAVCQNSHLDGIRVKAGRTFDWVQFRYAGRGWGDARGALGAKGGYTEVTLDPGEYFTRVEYRNGWRVDQIKLVSNRGRVVGPYGGGGGDPGSYDATPGEKLGCMRGRQGAELDRLTFTSTGPR